VPDPELFSVNDVKSYVGMYIQIIMLYNVSLFAIKQIHGVLQKLCTRFFDYFDFVSDFFMIFFIYFFFLKEVYKIFTLPLASNKYNT